MKRFLCLSLCLSVQIASAADWPQFRGPGNQSLAPGASLPIRWSEQENIAWKVELPGRGVSSPIVVRDRVFVTSNEGARQQVLFVLCFDAPTGRELWRRKFWATGRTGSHPTSANAAPTPASDGERIFAFFSSNDLACLDLDGNLNWYRGLSFDYPKSGNDVGMASSPTVSGDTVVVQIESQGDSFAAGLDTATGETRWRIDRDQKPNWASPIVIPASANGQRPEAVLLQSPEGLTAIEPTTGRELWKFPALCPGITSSVVHEGRLYCPIKGITVFGLPEASFSPEVVWDSNRMRPGSPSPVVHDGRLYTLTDGIVKCGDIKDGEPLWQLRINGKHWATPVIAAGHLYAIDQSGSAKVVKLGEKGELVGTSEFGEDVLSSPAVSGNALFVRGARHLWKIAAK